MFRAQKAGTSVTGGSNTGIAGDIAAGSNYVLASESRAAGGAAAADWLHRRAPPGVPRGPAARATPAALARPCTMHGAPGNLSRRCGHAQRWRLVTLAAQRRRGRLHLRLQQHQQPDGHGADSTRDGAPAGRPLARPAPGCLHATGVCSLSHKHCSCCLSLAKGWVPRTGGSWR